MINAVTAARPTIPKTAQIFQSTPSLMTVVVLVEGGAITHDSLVVCASMD